MATKIHLIGIGGIGMSGLAHILLEKGCEVSGSDRDITTAVCRRLEERGARLYGGHHFDNLAREVDLVVHSAAIPENNAELVAARELAIRCTSYASMIGSLMQRRMGIAVSGTHGKTTTTAMMSTILRQAGRDPGFLIGGEMAGWEAHGAWGRGPYFVAEACEYAGSFHHLLPHHAIITNIEADHLDYYKNIGEIEDAFHRFISSLPPGGMVIYSAHCPHSKKVVSRWDAKHTLSVGIGADSEADVYGSDIRYTSEGTDVKVYYRGLCQGRITIQVPGEHNLKNGLACFALARSLNIPFEDISDGLATFEGAKRRFQKVGEFAGADLIDDYAHHPTEIVSTLDGVAQRYPDSKVTAVFQPHQYSRTLQFFDEFAWSLKGVDEVIIPDIYAARDSLEDRQKVNAKMLASQINRLGGRATYMESFDKIIRHLAVTCRPEQVIITMGAGNVYEITHTLAEASRRHRRKSA